MNSTKIPSSTRTVQVGARHIHLSEFGSGKPVLMLHGGGPGASGVSNYSRNIDALAAAGFRVLVPDMPGYGKSSKGVADDPFGDLAGAMLGLLDALHIDRAHAVGNSLGGAVALRLALEQPARVGRLVLMGPGGVGISSAPPTDGLKRLLGYYAGEGPTLDKLRAFICGDLVFDASRITEDVLRGGHDAVHGVVWNFDESAVHVHWMCDTMAPLIRNLEFDDRQRVIGADGQVVMKYGKEQTLSRLMKVSKDGSLKVAPEISASQVRGVDGSGYLVDAEGSLLRRTTGEPVKASDHLRVEAQQMWGQSDEVTETRIVDGVEREVAITGATKTRRYQELYREQLVEAGFDVELEANPEGTSLDKSAFAVLESRRTELDEREGSLGARGLVVDTSGAWERLGPSRHERRREAASRAARDRGAVVPPAAERDDHGHRNEGGAGAHASTLAEGCSPVSE